MRLWGSLRSLYLRKGGLFHLVSASKKKTGCHIHSRKVARSHLTQSHSPTVVRQVSGGKVRN